jgi:hypothetical protein
MIPASIASQYALETAAFTLLVAAPLAQLTKKRDPRKAFITLAALNALRFGGVAGSLAAMASSSSPAFLVAVAIGDGVAATLAVAALALLLRRSDAARPTFVAMNVVGLLGILVSEAWLECLRVGGHLAGPALHGPTIGAALYSALHVFAFTLAARGARSPQNVKLVPSVA